MMNKQEAIEEINNLKGLTILDKTINFDSEMISKKEVLNIVKQLDEPKKPVVPQYVADWLEVCKDNLPLSLAHSMNNIIMMSNNQPDKTIHWIAKNSETFAKAWLYGYEVEKEKLYTVEIPNPNSAGGKTVLSKQQSTGKLILQMLNSDINKPKYLHLTEAEIKEDFSWLWQFAEEANNNDD